MNESILNSLKTTLPVGESKSPLAWVDFPFPHSICQKPYHTTLRLNRIRVLLRFNKVSLTMRIYCAKRQHKFKHIKCLGLCFTRPTLVK